MATEIEAKLKVDSFDEVRSLLAKLSAKACGNVVQRDYYFDNAQAAMSYNDMALRLRRQTGSGPDQNVLTYKGPKHGGAYKRRQEVQIGIDNAQATIELLAAIGYTASLLIEKRRERYELDLCEVSLDELPLLGKFIEIEGPDENAIASVQKKLGLDQKEHIKQGYAWLMQKYCGEHSIDKKEFVFE